MEKQIYNPMVLSEIQEHDIKCIGDIEKSCFSEPWSEKTIRNALEDCNYKFIVIKSNNDILGYININIILDAGYINNFAVNPKYQNLGIGDSILKASIDLGKKNKLSFLTLEVRKSNVKAISIYKKNNFLTVGIRKSFYRQPTEDAVLMTYYY